MSGRGRAQADSFARIAPHYDVLMSSVPYARWADYVCQLAALSGRLIRPGTHLLDLATGTGSVALEFASRGCVVTGLDLSEPMLVEARRKAAERGLSVTFLCHDLSDYHLPTEFDHAVCLYDSLNYLLDPGQLKQAFANTRSALRPGGLFVFDVNTVHALEAELFTQESPEGAAIWYRWISKYDRKTRTSRVTMEFRIAGTGQRFTVEHRQRAYTEADLRSFLFHAGFTHIVSYEAYRLTSPAPLTDRAFYVARADESPVAS